MEKMDDISFKRGMIAGLKIASKIIEKSSSETQVAYTINGALMALELIEEKVKDE